jgi:uncharacterized membrane protein YfcA
VDGGTAVLLAGAGLAAGAINSVAGGGSLVSFPALLAAGYPALTANVTNLIAVTPGYVGGSVGYRGELRGQGARARRLGGLAVVGALAGSALLLIAPASTFDAIAPFLVLLACALLALQPRLVALAARRHGEHSSALAAAIVLGGIYGGYFGAGLGIMMLALLGVFVDDDLHRLNAVKGVLSLVVSIAAALVLGIFGPVDWPACGVIAASSLVGGRLGVSVARRLSPTVLRWTIVVYGCVVAVVLLVR